MSKTFTASAPGRLDVMGGIADYSGSLVLQMPIRERTTVTISLRDDYRCSLKSNLSEGHFEAGFNYQDLVGVDYNAAHKILNQQKETSWIAYIIGCAFILKKEKGIDFKGADFVINSTVPLGKGVSSSAAVEVATMKALGQAFNIKFIGTELAILAQRVENILAGAPCGLMDQLASCFAIQGELLPIICQPDIVNPSIKIPGNIKFIGIDSGVRHAVSGSSYSEVRCAAFMGYSIIAQHLGVSADQLTGMKANLPYGGYLCNIQVWEFEEKFMGLLPNRITGEDFLMKYKTTTDSVTLVEPGSTYNILNCTRHPIYENDRVSRFKTILANFDSDKTSIKQLGELMYQSHESYSNCGLGSARTDEIVELARQHKDDGIYGAKITGGGSGGTVCLLVEGEQGLQSAKKIHRMMEKKYNTKLVFFD